MNTDYLAEALHPKTNWWVTVTVLGHVHGQDDYKIVVKAVITGEEWEVDPRNVRGFAWNYEGGHDQYLKDREVLEAGVSADDMLGAAGRMLRYLKSKGVL